jgi:hypothetical protein
MAKEVHVLHFIKYQTNCERENAWHMVDIRVNCIGKQQRTIAKNTCDTTYNIFMFQHVIHSQTVESVSRMSSLAIVRLYVLDKYARNYFEKKRLIVYSRFSRMSTA